MVHKENRRLRHGIAFLLLGTAFFVSRTQAEPGQIDPKILAQMDLSTPERALALAFRFAPGPQGLGFIVIDPVGIGDGEDGSRRGEINRMYLHIPNHPDWEEPRRLTVRRTNGRYTISSVRLSARHEDTTVEFIMEGTVRDPRLSRYLETSDFSLRVRIKLSGRLSYQTPEGRARFLVSRDISLSEGQFRGGERALSVRDFTAAPVMELRAVEGGRLVVANLVLGRLSGRARDWTYFFPLQDADNQIRVEALDERGTAIETIQLRNTRGGFDELDSWTGRLRRLQTGRRYTLRATVDLGILGKLEQTIPVKVFDF